MAASWLAALLLALATAAARAQTVQNNAPGHYLYIYAAGGGRAAGPSLSRARSHLARSGMRAGAGEANKTLGDTMLVIGWNNALNDGHPYGTIITNNVLNQPVGNEPNSMSVANFNYLMAGSGQLGFYTGQKKNQSQIFFWNMTDAKNIRPLPSSSNPPSSASPQDFYPTADGGFLVTMLGDLHGGVGGRVAKYDNARNFIAEYPAVVPSGFCPKGIAVNTALNYMITTDYYVINSTFNYPTPSAGIVAFSTVRVWNYTTMAITNTLTVLDAGAGMLQVKFLPGDSQGHAYVIGRFSGKIYLVTTKAPQTITVALDINTVPGVGPNPKPGQFDLLNRGLFNTTTNYKVGFVTLTGTGQVIYFNWANFTSIRVIQVFTIPPIAGRPQPAPNSLRVDLCCGTQGIGSPDSYRFIVTDYSLDETYSGPKPAANNFMGPLPQPYGLVQEAGTRQIHVFIFNATSIRLDPRFTLDLQTRFPGKAFNPRGISLFPTVGGGGA
eukprot:SM000059S18640  [mRNA]  locus=s59:19263:22325:- [translate_table: standard]